MFHRTITKTITKIKEITRTSTRHHTFTRHLPVATTTEDVYVTVTVTGESPPTTISPPPNMMPAAIPSRTCDSRPVTISLVVVIVLLLYILLCVFWSAYKQSMPTFRQQAIEAVKRARHERDQARERAEEMTLKHNDMVDQTVEAIIQLRRVQEVNAEHEVKLQRLKSAFDEMDGGKEIHSLTDLDLGHEDNFREWLHTWKVFNEEKLYHELEEEFFAENIELDRQNRELQAQIRELRQNYTNNGTIQPSTQDLEAIVIILSEEIRKKDEEIKTLGAGKEGS